jgi:glycosyltransferase involved in cell wall biosynthesis
MLKPAAGRVAVVLGRMPKGQTRWYRRVDRLLATSEAVAAKARAENPRIAPRIRVFPNPVDWQLHADAAREAPSTDTITIGYVGRLHPEKGLEILLEAATRLAGTPGLPPWRLVLVGPALVSQGGGGEGYRDGLVARFQPILGDRLVFLPPEYDAVKLAALYGGIDVFCYPSQAERGEGLSIAPIEAMSAAAVPVVSDLDCYRDLIRHEVDGLVFNHRAADAAANLAAALARLLVDAPFREILAKRAQATARSYDYVECAAALLDDFTRLTNPALGP